MYFDMHNMYCIKISDSLENIEKELKKAKFNLRSNSFVLEIYMIKKELYHDIFSKSFLDDYIVIKDMNNNKKELLIYEENTVILKGNIKEILKTKKLLENFGYVEFMHINTDIYDYINDENMNINLLDLKEYGIYLNFDKKLNIKNLTYKNTQIVPDLYKYILDKRISKKGDK